MDEISFLGTAKIQTAVLDELNESKHVDGYDSFEIRWTVEDSLDFKLSKGVFSPPGTENSFIVARLIHEESGACCYPFSSEIEGLELFPAPKFLEVCFYFSECGVGTCSSRILLQRDSGISVLLLEETSEKVNELFKKYFEKLSYELTKQYISVIESLEIPHHRFCHLPDISKVDRATHFIPWTHRIYHINDERLLSMENPGEEFRNLLTPSRKMDICDLSIYDNRYVYFGWGHSIIFSSSSVDGYSQTARQPYEYVRLVEIAQAQWQFLDVLNDIVKYSISAFNRLQRNMALNDLQDSINEVRDFRNGVDRILADYRGIKITFDTEKRCLLSELHERWLTQNLLDALNSDLDAIEDLLDQLYQRQKEQREESLNTIALLFTIVGIIEVITIFLDVLTPQLPLSPIVELSIIVFATFAVAAAIVLYLRLASRG